MDKEVDYSLCWLEYSKIDDEPYREKLSKVVKNIIAVGQDKFTQTAVEELKTAVTSLVGFEPEVSKEALCGDNPISGIIVGNVTDALIMKYISDDEIQKLDEEGYVIKSVKENPGLVVIGSKNGHGLVYGAFSFIKHIQLKRDVEEVHIIDNPKCKLRLLNHWDNMDGTVERGYAGRSIFFCDNKVTNSLGRIKDYARLLSSIGINGVVINNVNVNKNAIWLITPKYLGDLAKLADVFRQYGIKIYLSINFASPIYIGKLKTADPLDEDVIKWWKETAKTIYEYIPDFGGFLVKADSEFNPGPYKFGRDHADGANMLAEALAPYGGIVIWRCFVYNCTQDWRDTKTDRAKAAYDIFKPLDGKFAENVVLQVKYGPMDFQVREPVSPLFGGLERTNQLIELQITQEYTGQQIDLCYLATMWKEVLEFDTYAKGPESKVKYVVDGTLFNNKYSGFAGVSNVGSDKNWTGHWLAQANLYAFGMLAWDHSFTPEEIAREWCVRALTNDPFAVETIVSMLMRSWRVYEKYTAPLGIGWMVTPHTHYGPSVDGYEYSKWGTYHRADTKAIGIDRSVKSGTGFAGQYHRENAAMFESMETCPEELLLFFHRVPYDYVLKSGETLIQHIYNTHFEGAEEAEKLKEDWVKIKDYIRKDIYEDVLERFNRQIENAKEWRDVVNSYFYRKTGIPDKYGRKIY
uniref:Xylan alpha-1,2-glucuronidase n=1 Tax=Caldanaerobius polysaccharolyticus TaxID=44256 RepID=I6QTZ4_9THEO|nr:Agu67A [Caldanaerobius polysaccharolyticus]